jgi:putative ABC transport system substrate-binding protein
VDVRLAEIVKDAPRVIFAASARVALAAKASTASIPIVFGSVADPVRIGLVASLGRPGGNATGFTYDVLVEGKQLELVAELAPKARTIGVLEDGHWLGERITPEMVAQFERQLGRRIKVLRADGPEDIVALATSPKARGVDAWFVPISNAASERRHDLAEALNRQRRVAVYGRSFFVDAGGLAAYQELIADPMGIWREIFLALLRGTAPGAIPVQRPKQYELALNAATARRIGVPLSPGLLRRADRVVAAGND